MTGALPIGRYIFRQWEKNGRWKTKSNTSQWPTAKPAPARAQRKSARLIRTPERGAQLLTYVTAALYGDVPASIVPLFPVGKEGKRREPRGLLQGMGQVGDLENDDALFAALIHWRPGFSGCVAWKHSDSLS